MIKKILKRVFLRIFRDELEAFRKENERRYSEYKKEIEKLKKSEGEVKAKMIEAKPRQLPSLRDELIVLMNVHRNVVGRVEEMEYQRRQYARLFRKISI